MFAKLIEGGFIDRSVLEKDVAALERHLSDPQTLVTSHLFFRLCGRLPRVGRLATVPPGEVEPPSV